MKMTKILATAAVAAVVAFGFMACAAEEDDDELEAISGSNNNYYINFKNNTNDMYRCYATTYNKHLGGLCQITLDKASYDAGDGTIGYIFDLESNPNRAPKDPRTLCIVGYNLARKGIYVSNFTNVTDIKADNFGTKLSENPAKEKEYLALVKNGKTANPMELTENKDGKYVFTINVDGKTTPTEYKVDIYNGLVSAADLNGNDKPKPLYSKSIPLEDLYPTAGKRPKAIPQKDAAVYANVFQGKTMNATWHYDATYSADEIAE